MPLADPGRSVIRKYLRTSVLLFLLVIFLYSLTDGARIGEVFAVVLTLAALVLAFILDRRQVRRG